MERALLNQKSIAHCSTAQHSIMEFSMLWTMQQHPTLTYPLCLSDPQTQLSRPPLVLTEHSSHAALQVERDKTFSKVIINTKCMYIYDWYYQSC